MPLRLGIDTGGTYTDAVLIDAQNQVRLALKSLTTRHNLALGIAEALQQIPPEQVRNIELVSLSTTLTTNAVVEGNGAPVCVLLAGFTEMQVVKSRLQDIVAKPCIVSLNGGHDATGQELQPLDIDQAQASILGLQEQVSAFAIASQFSVRNPSHELRLQSLVKQLTRMPVTCGHELTTHLGAPRRALTACLNARMIPFIQQLIEAVRSILGNIGITAPLMIVKGDGSIVNADTALQCPVTTILSGPAASVIGGYALSGCHNAIIADMGGTTTDIAIMTDGEPELASAGAQVGDWQPMVETVKVYSIGLGGDSEVHFHGGNISLGPRRVIPLSLLAQQYPQLISRLETQLASTPSPRHNRFITRLEYNQALINQLNTTELKAWEMLEQGPVEMETLAFNDQPLAKAMARLERLGIAIYSGFTPSDAAHVLGKSNHWNQPAAILAASIWAQQMRYLYGYDSWAATDIQTASNQVLQLMHHHICQALIEAGLHQEDLLNQTKVHDLAVLMSDLILKYDQAGQSQNALFGIHFCKSHTLVAVGAAAATYYPDVANSLGLELKLPEYGHVANAVGAVMGCIVQRAEITINQPRAGVFRVFNRAMPFDCNNLTEAFSKAEAIVLAEATTLAKSAGAERISAHTRQHNKHVQSELSGELFVESKIIAVATGKPKIRLVDHT